MDEIVKKYFGLTARRPSYRQGDVLILPVAAIPAEARPVEREGGRIILAHGELTGHAHAIAEPEAEFFVTQAGQQYLSIVGAGATVRHEEHAPIALPPGLYQTVRQTEFSPTALRNVAD